MNYFFKHARDPISSYSHFIGAALSILGLAGMIVKVALAPDFSIKSMITGIVFCLSLIALYSASGIYHFVKPGPIALQKFRKLDHSMIYVLIAGTYTPALLGCLPLVNGITLTILIWVIAIIGILLKMFWMNAPRWLSTAIYIAMGWFIIIDVKNLSLAPMGLALLVAGGVAYTVGGVIYAIKKPNFSKNFGFHEFFHMFVILGSVLHYLFVFFYAV